MQFTYIRREVGNGLRRNLTMTLAVVVSVAVSLTLFGSALLMRSQVDRMKGYWYDKIEVSIFLCGPNSIKYSCTGAVTDSQRSAIKNALESLDPVVQEVFYESSAEAYDRFKKQFQGSPILANVTADALPESFRVKIDDPANFNKVNSKLANMQGVETVQDQRKLLERFFQILTGLQTFALAVALAMLFVTVLLVINTIRVSAFARRRETSIMRSVGASNSAIRLPFILEAAAAAAIGSTIAAGSILLVKALLIDQKLAPSIRYFAWVTWGDVLATLPWLFLVGVGATAISAMVTLTRYLKN